LFISSREDNSNSSKGCGWCGQRLSWLLVARLEVWTDTGCHPGTDRRTRGELPGSAVRSTDRPSCPRVRPRVWVELYPGAAQGDRGPDLRLSAPIVRLFVTCGRSFTRVRGCGRAVDRGFRAPWEAVAPGCGRARTRVSRAPHPGAAGGRGTRARPGCGRVGGPRCGRVVGRSAAPGAAGGPGGPAAPGANRAGPPTRNGRPPRGEGARSARARVRVCGAPAA
jgi:hypothetical protein